MEIVFDNTVAYGMGLCGSLLLMALLPYTHIALKYTCPLIFEVGKLPPLLRLGHLLSRGLKQLAYTCIATRSGILKSWSVGNSLLVAAYLAANLTCIFIDLPTAEKAGARAGTLALINMLILYLGPCLSFIADVLHISLRAHRRIHAYAGRIVLMLTIFHTIVAVIRQGSFSLKETRNIWPFVAQVMCFFLVLPIWLLKRVLPYEFILFHHHLISILVIYFTWRHLPAGSLFPRLYLYIILGIFMWCFILQTGITLYRTGFKFSWARVFHDEGVIRVTIHLDKELKVEPGQYINLWTWSTPLSLMQSHPFTVVSYSSKPQVVSSSGKPQARLELVVEPHQGWTKSLDDLLAYGDTTIITSFTGPHGRWIPVDKLDNVLLAATGSGIIAILPYLERLIHNHGVRQTCTRRIHLVWEVEDSVVWSAAQKFINGALSEDKNMGERCTACGGKHESFRVTICMELSKALQAYIEPPPTLEVSERNAAVNQKAPRAYIEAIATLIASRQNSRRSDVSEEDQTYRNSLDSSEKGQVLKKRTADTIDVESTSRVGTVILGGRAMICDPPVPWHQILKRDIDLKPAGKLLHVVASVSEITEKLLTDAIRGNVNDVSLVYPEYQP